MPPGPFETMMDRLVAVEEAIAPGQLVRHRWRPEDTALPAIWNWLDDSPHVRKDQNNVADTYVVLVLIGVTPKPTAGEMASLEMFVDAAQDVIDRALEQGPSALILDGVTVDGFPHLRRAVRTQTRQVSDAFNEKSVRCAELRLEIELWRQIPTSL